MLKHVKTGFLLLLLDLIPWLVYSQESLFREIYPYIETRNFIEAIPRLREFLITNSDHPSANFQLAIIYEERYKQYHPLLQYSPAVKNADNARLYFLKANLLVDEKEVKRNGKRYYTNFARPDERGRLDVSYSDVKGKADSAYIQIDLFLRNIHNIYQDFTGAVSNYDAASRNFAEITGQFNSLKDLLLLFDRSLDNRLNKLKDNYDSSIYYLEHYLSASKLYPVLKYGQSYEVKKIDNFRLDGLQTQTDFLAGRISLWDYGTWVGMVKEMHTSDIQKLRDQLSVNEERILANLKALSDPAAALSSGTGIQEIDKDLILKLRNYDHHSVIVPVLQYQQAKQNLLFRSLHEHELMEDSLKGQSSEYLLSYYGQLFSMSITGDSLINHARQVNNEFNRQKHAEFMKKYFPGNTGLEDYINKEAKIMKDKIAGYAHNFREITVNDLVYFNDSLAQASLKKIVIPLYVSIMDTATMVPDRYYTSQLVLAPDSSILAVGNIKPGRGKGVIQTSLSRVKDSGDLLWVKNLTEVKPAGGIVCDMIGTLTVVPEGYAVVVNRYDMVSKEIGNFFMLIGDSGDTLVSFPVPIPGFPKKIMYSESDGSYLIITKGRGPIENISDDEPMEWIKINRDGGVIWKNRLSFAGDIKELIAMKTGHIIFGNFTRIKDTSGKVNVLTTTSGETAAYAIIIDEEGNASGIKCFNSIVPWQLLTARKISGDIICLLGKSGIYTTGIFEPIRGNSGLVQFIIDGNLDVLFEEKN